MSVRHTIFERVLCLVLATLVAVPAFAQEKAVVMVHGLASGGAQWSDTANRLAGELSIDTRTPDVPWRERYAAQASQLNAQGAIAALPGRPIAIGHSNGGIVSREWSRLRPLDGVITIGTPHQGAPLMPQFWNFVVFQDSTSYLVSSTAASFGRASQFTWAMAYLVGPLGWVADFSIWTVIYLAASLGLSGGLPVANDMRPGSDALLALNSAANLERERASMPARVGISSVAHNFYWAGPARAAIPAQADAVAYGLYTTIAALGAWGSYIFLRADHADFAAIDQASSLFGLAAHLGSLDPLWCTLVSSVSINQCVENDGVVPMWSQLYPGAANVFLGFDGPAHTQEMAQSDVMRDVLIEYFRVPRRAVPPPPPPSEPPPPPPPPPSEPSEPPPSDGGSTQPPGTVGGDYLTAGQSLLPNQYLRSANGLYWLAYQNDGNLVLYDVNGTPLWASDTANTNPGFVRMESDGTLTIYDSAGFLLFDTFNESGNRPGSFLIVQNDGNVVIYDAAGQPTWHTGTAQ